MNGGKDDQVDEERFNLVKNSRKKEKKSSTQTDLSSKEEGSRFSLLNEVDSNNAETELLVQEQVRSIMTPSGVNIMIGVWNIRGLNKLDRHGAVRHFLKINKMSFLGIVETRVKAKNFSSVKKACFRGWSVMNNYIKAVNGRIWICWNEEK